MHCGKMVLLRLGVNACSVASIPLGTICYLEMKLVLEAGTANHTPILHAEKYRDLMTKTDVKNLSG